ncbi:MAG TPA: homocysteine biosynthesis protein [Petrotogaceae bacterium]|nr:homocysteine biosynthesis protein [Petrotogaceae bacterium]HOG33606.1 homocysteine biosynthesis protein [Petrotogaceae bacterium]
MSKNYEEINKKIQRGEAVVVTAQEIIDIVQEKGVKETAEYVDVVTTATFGPMCSSGAFLNFGHSDPPIRMTKTYLNGVESYSGLAAVDAYLGATQNSEDKGMEYGGAHVIRDLIERKKIHLKAYSYGTDCYPEKEIDTFIDIDSINEAYLYNPRNVYQNYNAAVNSSEKLLYTYMGILHPFMGNVTYSGAGELSPLINDPYYRTIGVGTRIFIGGSIGYVSWSGTQFKSSVCRGGNGVPIGPGGTLALTGNLKEMDSRFVQPAVFEKYGVSMFMGIGIPIPVLDEDMLRYLCVSNRDIYTNIIDYGCPSRSRPVIKKVSYAELMSGKVEINGHNIRSSPLSSMRKAREIAQILKKMVASGRFMLTQPVKNFDKDMALKSLERNGKNEDNDR